MGRLVGGWQTAQGRKIGYSRALDGGSRCRLMKLSMKTLRDLQGFAERTTVTNRGCGQRRTAASSFRSIPHAVTRSICTIDHHTPEHYTVNHHATVHHTADSPLRSDRLTVRYRQHPVHHSSAQPNGGDRPNSAAAASAHRPEQRKSRNHDWFRLSLAESEGFEPSSR